MAIKSTYEVLGLDGKVVMKTTDIKEARKAEKIVAASESVLDIIKGGLPEDHGISDANLIIIAQHIIEKKQEVGDLLKSFREGKKKDGENEPGENDGAGSGEQNPETNGGNPQSESGEGDGDGKGEDEDKDEE